MKSEEVRDRLRAAKRPVALTGAGVSAESGVPPFRGSEGLWRNFNPQDLATPEAFERNPQLVWEWYDWRRSLIAKISPNPAHYALAELERRSPGFTLITQNVDGLHRAAGSSRVLEIHGSIWIVKCVECGNSSENRDVPINIVPRCSCGGRLRPGVGWFGESLPEELIYKAFEAASSADLMLVVGTSGVVQPAASLATRAKQGGAFFVGVNTDATPPSGVADPCCKGKGGG